MMRLSDLRWKASAVLFTVLMSPGSCYLPVHFLVPQKGVLSLTSGIVGLSMSSSGPDVGRVKNENPDDFATYMAKRKAKEEGRDWTSGPGALLSQPGVGYAQSAPSLSGQRSSDGRLVRLDNIAICSTTAISESRGTCLPSCSHCSHIIFRGMFMHVQASVPAAVAPGKARGL